MEKDHESEDEMCHDKYIDGLNDGTIYKQDLIESEETYKKIKNFDPETLMKLPGALLVIAMTGAGKTVMIKHFLKVLENHYKEVHLISSTAMFQSCYNFMPRENIQETYSDEYIENIYKSRSMKKKADNSVELEPILIIFDDIINDENYKKARFINNIYTQGRQLNISVWFLSQSFTAIKPIQRLQARWAVSFCHDTANERDKFSESYMSLKSNSIAKVLFNKITKSKKYQAVVVESYKVGEEASEKIKKFIANDKIKDPKIKPIIRGYYLMDKYGTSKNVEPEIEIINDTRFTNNYL